MSEKPKEIDYSLAFILGTKHGRRWMYQHLGACGLFMNSFAGQRETTDFNCGRQSIAQELLIEIEATVPGSFALMVKESQLTEEIEHDGSDSDGGERTGSGSNANNGDNYDPFATAF